MTDVPLICERCGAMNKPPPAKPTLELEPNGTVSCSACAHNFPMPKDATVVLHTAHLEWTAPDQWRVVCSCGWVSDVMGHGDAYTTKERGLEDQGHDAYARQVTQ
jgi:hypothetical protein